MFSTNLYQYTKVFKCDMSTFIFTNKFNQYYCILKHPKIVLFSSKMFSFRMASAFWTFCPDFRQKNCPEKYGSFGFKTNQVFECSNFRSPLQVNCLKKNLGSGWKLRLIWDSNLSIHRSCLNRVGSQVH